MRVAIPFFPGSNCDRDAFDAAAKFLGADTQLLWHNNRADLNGYDLVIIPGGFTYGDYLRTGAIARFAPVMEDVRHFAKNGGLVIGICNGFQILTECRLLPGALVKNKSLKFICDNVQLKVENASTPFSSTYTQQQIITLPVAHGEGNYTADTDVIKQLEDNHQVVFRYVDDIKQGNVLGMMPHPERTLWANETFSGDGALLFESIAKHAGQLAKA